MVGDGDAVSVDLFLGGGVIDSPCVFNVVIVTGKQIGRASCRERVCQYV